MEVTRNPNIIDIKSNRCYTFIKGCHQWLFPPSIVSCVKCVTVCVPRAPSASLVYTLFSVLYFCYLFFLRRSTACFLCFRSLKLTFCCHLPAFTCLAFLSPDPDKISNGSEQTAITTKVPPSNTPKLITLQWYQTEKGRRTREHFAFFSSTVIAWETTTSELSKSLAVVFQLIIRSHLFQSLGSETNLQRVWQKMKEPLSILLLRLPSFHSWFIQCFVVFLSRRFLLVLATTFSPAPGCVFACFLFFLYVFFFSHQKPLCLFPAAYWKQSPIMQCVPVP